jgi:hypothetical protein
MPGQNTAFHELLERIAKGETRFGEAQDVDTVQQLISFGFVSADYAQIDGHLVYLNTLPTKAGFAYMEDWDAPHGDAVR